MCLITFQYHKDSDYPFILLANRDEHYTRSTVGIHFWPEHPNMLAGRDLKAGGTWMGLTRTGQFGTLVNHPFSGWETAEPPVTRGDLVTDYLVADRSVTDYHEQLSQNRDHYLGYHFLYGDINELSVYSNVSDKFETFSPTKTHSVSNTDDHLSLFRKERAARMLDNYLDTTDLVRVNDLVELFHDTKKSPEMTHYPDHLTQEQAHNASSIFIEDPIFGTVATTVILVDKKGIVTEKEVRYNPAGPVEATTKQFKLKSVKK